MSCHSRSIAINAAIIIDNEIFFNILYCLSSLTRRSMLIQQDHTPTSTAHRLHDEDLQGSVEKQCPLMI